MQDTAIATDALQRLLADMDDQNGPLQRVIAMRHNDDFDARQGRRVKNVPVRYDQWIANFTCNRVDDEHGTKPQNHMLTVSNDLFQNALAVHS